MATRESPQSVAEAPKGRESPGPLRERRRRAHKAAEVSLPGPALFAKGES